MKNKKYFNTQKKINELKEAKALRAFAQSPFFLDFFYKKFFEMNKTDRTSLVKKSETLKPSLAEFRKLAKFNKHLNVSNEITGKTYKTYTVVAVNALNILCIDDKGKKIIL